LDKILLGLVLETCLEALSLLSGCNTPQMHTFPVITQMNVSILEFFKCY